MWWINFFNELSKKGLPHLSDILVLESLKLLKEEVAPKLVEQLVSESKTFAEKGKEWLNKGERIINIDCYGVLEKERVHLFSIEYEDIIGDILVELEKLSKLPRGLSRELSKLGYTDTTLTLSKITKYKATFIFSPYNKLFLREPEQPLNTLILCKDEEKGELSYFYDYSLPYDMLGRIVTNDRFWIICLNLSEEEFFKNLIENVSMDKNIRVNSLPEEVIVKYAEYRLKA
ncbi:MAG: hypothetical protein ACXQTS_06085 [Candidatus Methanospirareceae archaeon]